MQATTPRVGLPVRTPPSAHSRAAQGGRERGAASEPGPGSGKGGYDFRRVAIRRKSNPAYLLPGTPRPWSRPASHLHLGRAEKDTFTIQPSADAPGESFGRDGGSGGLAPGRDARGARRCDGSAGCGGSQRGGFPGGVRGAAYPLTNFVPSPKGPCLGGSTPRAELA